MSDPRESIIQRLVAICGTLGGQVLRNETDVHESRLPLWVIMDADEATDENSLSRARSVGAPLIMVATPEIYYIANGNAAAIGGSLNAKRAALIKAVLLDTALLNLLHDNDARYLGMTTALAAGRSLEGMALFHFEFRYVLRPMKI